jgi:hypothetical protein
VASPAPAAAAGVAPAAEAPALAYAEAPAWRTETTGPPTRAFAELQDRLAAAGETTLRELALEVADPEDTVGLLDGWSAVTNALAGAQLAVEHDLETRGPDGERLTLHFAGPARHFARLQSLVREALRGAAPDFLVTRVRGRFPAPVPVADPRFADLARTLTDTYRVGKVGVKAR